MTWESLRFDDLRVLNFADLIVSYFDIFDLEDLRVCYNDDSKASKVDLKVFDNLSANNSI